MPIFLFVVLLEIRASQNLTELGGGVRKMSGMRGQERNRVNCVTGREGFKSCSNSTQSFLAGVSWNPVPIWDLNGVAVQLLLEG